MLQRLEKYYPNRAEKINYHREHEGRGENNPIHQSIKNFVLSVFFVVIESIDAKNKSFTISVAWERGCPVRYDNLCR